MSATSPQVIHAQPEPVKEISRPVFRVSNWCHSRGKRAFDCVVAGLMLLAGSPLLLLAAIFIKLTSEGPAVFKQRRVGRDGCDFTLYKLRTMTNGSDESFPALTASGDPRITPVGRIVRLMKVDEIPQLYNVLRGDMSMVGWRPHLRRLLGDSPEQADMLSLKPGVTGIATVKFRHEERLLPSVTGKELESFYVRNLLPEKIALELKYASAASFWSDAKVLFMTFGAVLARNDGRKPSASELQEAQLEESNIG
jgi:lipopolysaccharide/colanic/teichoic acid biosynthesis glycosyltransferase